MSHIRPDFQEHNESPLTDRGKTNILVILFTLYQEFSSVILGRFSLFYLLMTSLDTGIARLILNGDKIADEVCISIPELAQGKANPLL